MDVGAYVGEFSIPASYAAQQVITIEPDPRTFECLCLQINQKDNITAVNELVHNESITVDFKSAADGSESSIIDVDQGDYEVIRMRAKRLDEILSNFSIDRVDFLKLAVRANPLFFAHAYSIDINTVIFTKSADDMLFL